VAKSGNGVSRVGGCPSGKPPPAAITPARLSGAVRPSMLRDSHRLRVFSRYDLEAMFSVGTEEPFRE
jgi:hypothetical protein